MTGPQFFVIDEGLLPWDLEAAPPTPRVEFVALEPVLRHLRKAVNGTDLRLLVTTQVNGKLPLQGSDVVVMCISDEISRVPIYDTPVGLVFKTFGTRRPPLAQLRGASDPRWLMSLVVREARVQQLRAPSVLRGVGRRGRHRSPPVVDIPVGALVRTDAAATAFADRTWDVAYLGSQANMLNRGSADNNPKARSRRELLEAMEQIAGWQSTPRVYTAARGSYHQSHHFRDEYVEVLANTRIAPSPRGWPSLETSRFFEALAFGCVVVVEELPDRYYYSGAPVARVKRWSQLPQLVSELLAQPEAMLAMHEAGIRWWNERCAPAAIGHRMAGAIRERVGSG